MQDNAKNNDKQFAEKQYTFNELLNLSFKSEDTEEWLDVHFTRPIGLVFALFWNRLGIHPNTITILSIFLGVGAAFMFYFTDFVHNVIGVILLMLANFCDSTDGQMARITGKKTLIGRILDGFSGDVWFFAIYIALCLRLMPQKMPAIDTIWGVYIWIVAFVAGVLCHSPQSSLSDYYRQIHLFFLKGNSESELDSYDQQRQNYEYAGKEKVGWKRLILRLFYYNYANYCRSQQERTPVFQKMMSFLLDKYKDISLVPQNIKDDFLSGSRPLMAYANILTFNVRAICLYVTCLLNIPWLYFLFEILILTCLYIYMHRHHEHLCERIYQKYYNDNNE